MKINELISELKDVKEHYGNVEIQSISNELTVYDGSKTEEVIVL